MEAPNTPSTTPAPAPKPWYNNPLVWLLIIVAIYVAYKLYTAGKIPTL